MMKILLIACGLSSALPYADAHREASRRLLEHKGKAQQSPEWNRLHGMGPDPTRNPTPQSWLRNSATCNKVLCPKSVATNPAYAPLCTAFHKGSGVISSDEMDAQWFKLTKSYPPNFHCTWTIYGGIADDDADGQLLIEEGADKFKPLGVRFDFVDLEASHDWLKIYDAGIESYTHGWQHKLHGWQAHVHSHGHKNDKGDELIPLRSYSCDTLDVLSPCYRAADGTSLLPNVVAPSGVIFISFESDASYEKRGFNLSFVDVADVAAFQREKPDPGPFKSTNSDARQRELAANLRKPPSPTAAASSSSTASSVLGIAAAVVVAVGVAIAAVAAYRLKKKRTLGRTQYGPVVLDTVQDIDANERTEDTTDTFDEGGRGRFHMSSPRGGFNSSAVHEESATAAAASDEAARRQRYPQAVVDSMDAPRQRYPQAVVDSVSGRDQLSPRQHDRGVP